MECWGLGWPRAGEELSCQHKVRSQTSAETCQLQLPGETETLSKLEGGGPGLPLQEQVASTRGRWAGGPLGPLLPVLWAPVHPAQDRAAVDKEVTHRGTPGLVQSPHLAPEAGTHPARGQHLTSLGQAVYFCSSPQGPAGETPAGLGMTAARRRVAGAGSPCPSSPPSSWPGVRSAAWDSVAGGSC